MLLIWLTLAFFSGLAVADYTAWPFYIWMGGSIFSLFLMVVKRIIIRRARKERLERDIPGILLGVLLFCSLGGLRYQISQPDLKDPHFIASYTHTDLPLVVTGVVTDFPDTRDTYINLRVVSERVRLPYRVNHKEVEGQLLAKIPVDREVHYGDRVVLRGQIQTPPDGEDFSYRDYLVREGIYAYMPNAQAAVLEHGAGNPVIAWIYSLKEKSLAAIYRLWPDPEASLFAGILLGVEAGIPAPVKEDFKETGTSHIIAISGFNITIVAGLFSSFFQRFLNSRWSALAAVGGIVLYTIFVGADAAVVRAAVMGGFALFAREIGRRQHGLNALAGASLIMAIFNPQLPWDLSFQLSLTATLGLVLYAEPLQEWFVNLSSKVITVEKARKISEPVGEFILFTFAAQLTTFPVMVYHFGSLSLTAFLANPVILPVQPPIMTLGGLAVILALIYFPLGKAIAPLVWPWVLFSIRAVEFFANLEGGVVHFPEIGLTTVFIFYSLLFLWTFGRDRLPTPGDLLRPSLILSVLAIGVILTWRAYFTAPDGYLHIDMLDVGDGESFLIRTPLGRRILINGGPSTSLLSEGLGRRLPPFQHHVDFLLVGSPEERQVAALPRVIDRFPPAGVLWAGMSSPGRAADYLRSAVEKHDIPLEILEAGCSLELGRGAHLEVLEVNPRGAVFLLEWDRFRMVIPGGIGDSTFSNLENGARVGDVDVLLLADQGYAPSNPELWIDNLKPRILLLSVSADNPDGLPDRELIDRLPGYTMLRTDQNGWVHIKTDGREMWVDVEELE